MMQLQVKAKSGLHAGAVWNLSKSYVTLGGSARADIFLCDPEIPDSLITLSRHGRRYVIEGMDPSAKLISADNSKVDNTLFPSQTLTLDFRHIQLDFTLVTAGQGLASRFGEGYSRLFHTGLRFLQGLGARAIVAFLFVIGLLMTSMILFFGTAGVAKTQASMLERKKELAERQVQVPIGVTMAANIVQDLTAFAKRQGTKGISVRQEEDKVEIDAELSRVQAMDFERELIRFGRDYGQFVELKANVRFTPEQKLVDEIRVSQIVLGKSAAVVLHDGAMLFEGGKYNGLTITKISMDKVVLNGSTSYEVPL